MPKTPAYRKRSGYDQAIVTLTDAVTKRRRDYWLGEYGSPASRDGRGGTSTSRCSGCGGCFVGPRRRR